METTTETKTTDRELTPTEIKITLAQIEDRLTRFMNAGAYVRDKEEEKYEGDTKIIKTMSPDDIKKMEDGANDEWAGLIADWTNEAKAKHDIPEGVNLLKDCAIRPYAVKHFMQFAKWWVMGKMDEEIFNLFCFHFCEIDEVDYNWVLMEEPSWYYDVSEGHGKDHLDGLTEELKRIGTRSKKKAKINFKLHL